MLVCHSVVFLQSVSAAVMQTHRMYILSGKRITDPGAVDEAQSVCKLFCLLLAGGLCARLHQCMARECRKQELHIWIGLDLGLVH